MGGGSTFPASGEAAAPRPCQAFSFSSPRKDAPIFPTFIPQTPPRFHPPFPPEFLLSIRVENSLSKTGRTTCRISMFSKGFFNDLKSCWEVPLMAPDEYHFTLKDPPPYFFFTCEILRTGAESISQEIGDTYETRRILTDDQSFLISLSRNKDALHLDASITTASSRGQLTWRNSMRRVLDTEMGASPSDE